MGGALPACQKGGSCLCQSAEVCRRMTRDEISRMPRDPVLGVMPPFLGPMEKPASHEMNETYLI